MARLNCKENGKFTFAWLDLWNAVINNVLLSFKEKEKLNRALNEFIINLHDHEDCRQKKLKRVTVHEIHMNQKPKYMKVAEVCKRMQMPKRIPDN